MKKIFTFILSALLCTWAFGQGKEAVFPKVGEVKPVIDGTLDEVWTNVEQHNITTQFKAEVATVGAEGTTYWKAMWDEDGIYVIVVVNDNVWSPYTGEVANSSDYNYDKIEMYFDTNYILDDHVGGQILETGNRQIAPNPTLDKLDGEMLVGKVGTLEGVTYNYAFKVDNPTWNFEVFVPWGTILDKDLQPFDKNGIMGFDVQVTDNDDGLNARNRVYWSNAGGKDESWNNMDDAGHVTLADVGDAIDIESIAISGDQAITTDNGTVQLTATVLPENATQGYKWIITEGADNATITSKGVVSAIRNGEVKVKAVSVNEYTESNEMTIAISGQVTTYSEVSFIKDGTFSMGTGNNQSSYWSGGRAEAVEDGVYTIVNPTLSADPWGYTVGQTLNIPQEMKDLPFVLQFKAWADEPRIFDVDIEHGDPFVRFGDTPDENSDGGKSQWTYNLTTEPTVYTQTITNFSRMEALPQSQKFNLFAGRGTAKVYVDNIILVTKEDFDNLTTSSKSLNASSIQVFPNPVGKASQITVNLVNAKGNIAVFNSVGQKIMEKTATGNTVRFDVSGLQKGIYFVKTSDGAIQKFIR